MHEFYRISNKSNTKSATSGSGTMYLSGAPDFIPDCSSARVAQFFCEVFCRLLFVLFLLANLLSVLQITASEYPF